MQLTRTITVLEVVSVVVALVGLVYGARVVRDATKVLRVIRVEGDSQGLEEIAKLLVVTTSILVFVFVLFLVAAGLSLTIPTPEIVTPAAYVRQLLFVLVGIALAYMLFYKHRVRQRVLSRDMADKDLREAATLELARVQLEQNTVALEANTTATEAATDAMHNGGLAVQIDATRALDANTASRVSDAKALLVAAAKVAQEHLENTQALTDGTAATVDNTSAVDRSTEHHRHELDTERQEHEQ